MPESAADPGEYYVAPNVRRLILFGAVVSAVVGTLGTAFLPYLMVHQPVWLLVSSSDGRNLLLAAPRVELPLLLAIAIPRRVISMLATYGVALLYGRALIGWSAGKFPRVARAFAWFERVFVRWRRAALVFWPTYTTAALAGVTRTEVGGFWPWMVLGQSGYVVVSYWVGEWLGEWTGRLLEWVKLHLWETSAVFVIAVAVQQIVSYARRRRARARAQATELESPPA